ncbi:hypothetical protein DL98DRAFT_251728 [Cadophora sp. DSE1049]|nr:hypothetical protein DL98DRAFT_251728 [Cadophora sp. DSE1049]
MNIMCRPLFTYGLFFSIWVLSLHNPFGAQAELSISTLSQGSLRWYRDLHKIQPSSSTLLISNSGQHELLALIRNSPLTRSGQGPPIKRFWSGLCREPPKPAWV